jgi:signal transduction histidine kinase/ligand-binding sensor domain-containing protein
MIFSSDIVTNLRIAEKIQGIFPIFPYAFLEKHQTTLKFRLTIWAALLHLCTATPGRAQQLIIRSYTIEDGLVNNDVLQIRQDSRGFLWICTRGGLSRYDGARFTNFTTSNGLTNDMINDIAEIAPQKFIVAQNEGGPRLLENDQLKELTANGKFTINRFYRTNNNRLIAATDESAMVSWENNAFHPIDNSGKIPINEMAIFNDSLWAVVINDISFQLMTSQLQPYSKLTNIDASFICTDSRHRTWLGTTSGLKLLASSQHRGEPIQFSSLPPAFDVPLLKTTGIADLLEDSQGNFWIATIGGGIVNIGANGSHAVYTESDGLPSTFINCLTEDQHNNIWAGTPLGLAKISQWNEISIFTHKQGISIIGSGLILPGRTNSIRLFDSRHKLQLNLSTNHITPIVNDSFDYLPYRVDTDELVLVDKDVTGRFHPNGHRVYKGNNEKADRIDWPPIQFYCVVRLDPDYFIGAFGNKLMAISNGKAKEKIALPGLSLINVLAKANDSILWASTLTNGIYKLKWHRNESGISMELIDSIGPQLPDRQIRALFCDKDNALWAGTRYKGVVRIRDAQKGKFTLQSFGTEDGLSSNFVRTINQDGRGNIWVGTQQGLDKLIPSDNGFRIFPFGKINNIYYQVKHIGFLPNDHLATEGQVLVYAKDLQQDTLPPPPVYITKVSTEGATDTCPTLLSWRKPQIYFEFCAPQSVSDQWNDYQYRLLGSTDPNWTKAPPSRSVYFASLKPGDYTFEVKVLGFNGSWSAPARHAFLVSTPFWQTSWFIALIAAAVALLVYLLYRYRIRQLLRLQAVRNQIAGDLHDEIGSNLTNISILSSLGKRNITQPQQASNFLDRISEEVAASAQSLDDIIWSVNTHHDTLEETVARMRLYAAELFDSAGIRYELQLDPFFETTRLMMEQRRDIYMIYKEALNNIVKHAQAKQVLIRIGVTGRHFILHIRDDGKGYNPGRTTGRHGLTGMLARVKRWRGVIQVETGVNKGVSLHIDLPLLG